MGAMPIDIHPTAWREVVLVCRKCGKKLGNEGFGPGGQASLPRALKAQLRRTGRRQEVRVVDTRCLGVCPKRAVSVLRAGRPGEVLTVPPGTGALAVLDRLDVA